MPFRACHLWIEGSLFFIFASSMARSPECADLLAFLQRLASRFADEPASASYYPERITAEERESLEELLDAIPIEVLKEVGMLDLMRHRLSLEPRGADVAVIFV